MGLDINTVRFLITAREQGAKFDSVLTLGRLSLNVYPAKMVQILEKHGLPAEEFRKGGDECFLADPFFRSLGAREIAAMDASDFEGATHVHDLNVDIPQELRQRFDAVIDGGTIEHVFNFPVALRNCMDMARVGGRVFIHNCANNLCGHGFYQFSPELFYRAMSPENGFEVERCVLHRVGPYGPWYNANDPETIRERVLLISFTPIHLLVQARRTAAVPIFKRMPFQSDYSVMWKEGKPEGAEIEIPKAVLKAPRLSRTFPGLARLLHAIRTGLTFYQEQSFRNRRYYRRVPKE